MLEKEVSQWIWKRMIEQYHTIFNLFIKSTQVIASDLETYTTQNFKRFLWDNLIEKNWSSSTYNSYRKYLRCFCEFLITEWYFKENPLDNIQKRKIAKQLPRALSKSQTQELLNNIPSTFGNWTFMWKRNQVIVYTYLYTGLRLSELTNLKLSDIQVHEWYLKVIKWKWSKDRIVPLGKEINKKLSYYIQARKEHFEWVTTDILFPTAYWNILQKRDLRTIIDKLRDNLSFYFTWHQLRHTYATELVRNNFDIYNIARILWHTRIDTTKIYLSVDTQNLKKQLDNVPLFA